MACSHPKVFKNHLIPCGNCISCRKKRVNDWAVRLELERKFFPDSSLFVTLTYNNENLPNNRLLSVRDYQLFLKRLRKQVSENYFLKIRYFLSGEYGDKKTKNYRPHFHLVIYGLPFEKWAIDLINKTWNKGFINVKPLTFKNARYVAKYCVKQFQKEIINLTTGEVMSEFVKMSRKIGIGYCVLTNDALFKNCITPQGLIKLGKFSYSIPYSIKWKAKQLNIQLPSEKKIHIVYNNFMFDIETFKKNFSFKNFCQLNNISKKDIDNLEFIPITEYIQELLEIRNKELIYSTLMKVNYYEFYSKTYKNRFPFTSSIDYLNSLSKQERDFIFNEIDIWKQKEYRERFLKLLDEKSNKFYSFIYNFVFYYY